tara:strand:- start:3418 stop:5004 length:1587 start_codon:yes stop_codon:yes gene_type:complete
MNQNETYLGNSQVKRDGVQQGWTKPDIQEYQHCMTDPVYFAQTYGKVISLDEGLVPFDLYPYQKEMFNHFQDNRFSIVLACRQSGKSISSCMYILWYALFHPDQTIAILANKGATAREMLARITLALENTPFFLQPGTKALNKGSIEFSNNSRIIAAATSGSSIRGLSVNLLFLDEFAFVENAAQFYTSTYPVISSGKTSRVIVTSTANGIGNTFHKIYEGAVQEVNEFKPFRVDWWNVPGRDEEWKRQTIANTSELQFQQEFGNTFFGTGNTLISADALMNMKAEPSVSVGDVNVYAEPKANHDYIMTVDVARGRGQDYSTFNIIDITARPFKQVACYRNNLISPILYPDIIHKWAMRYNEAYVIIESNDQGAVVANGLYYDIEYENTHVESMIKAGAIGMTMTRKVKRIGCSNLKDLIEEKKIDIVDLNTISECSTFEARGNSFEASDGNHDDLVMNLVMFAWYVGSEAFVNQTDVSIKQMLYEEKIKAIEDDITPVGIIDDGTDSRQQEVIDGDVWETGTNTGLF